MKIENFCCVAAELQNKMTGTTKMSQIYYYRAYEEETLEDMLSTGFFNNIQDRVKKDDMILLYEPNTNDTPQMTWVKVVSNMGGIVSVAEVAPSSPIPEQVQADWEQTNPSLPSYIKNKPTLGTMAAESASDYTKTEDLATVATTGDYDDLDNKPTIPTVNNSTITLTQGGAAKGSFTLNQASNGTIDFDAGGSSRNIGEIVQSTIPLTDAGLHLLDGTLINGSGSYSAFVGHISDLYSEMLPSATYVYNADITGTLTNNDGVLSGFGNSNYATLPNNFNTNRPFEAVFSFTTGSTINDESIVGNYQIYTNNVNNWYGLHFRITNNGTLEAIIGNGTSTPVFTNETQTLSTNTKYKAKLTFDGTEYKYYLAIGSGDYSLIASVTSSSTMVYNTSYPTYLGCHYIGHSSTTGAYFSGSIDLNESYIDIDGSRWWSGATQIMPCFCEEWEWQSAVATYGVCGKYVYDSINNTVRLPKYSDKIWSGGGTAGVKGNGKALGLTNGESTAILGRPSTSPYGDIQWQTLPADLSTTTAPNAAGIGTFGITTDPTKSGIITDLSTITTALDGYWYICIATTTKTEIEVDIDQITADLNGKADKDLSNITNIPQIFKTVAVNSMGIDTSTAISRSLNTNYTATRDCWVFHDQNANNNSVFYVDGVAVSDNYWHPERTSAKGSALVFVAIGQTWQAAGGTSVVEFGILGDL